MQKVESPRVSALSSTENNKVGSNGFVKQFSCQYSWKIDFFDEPIDFSVKCFIVSFMCIPMMEVEGDVEILFG